MCGWSSDAEICRSLAETPSATSSARPPRDELDRDLLLKLVVGAAREVHDAHAAPADLREQLVGPIRSPARERGGASTKGTGTGVSRMFSPSSAAAARDSTSRRRSSSAPQALAMNAGRAPVGTLEGLVEDPLGLSPPAGIASARHGVCL